MVGSAPRHLGDFEVLTTLASGGMGDVLLAQRRNSHGFDKLFAIKTIRHDLAPCPEIRLMFLDEARLLARLNHPRIAQVFDFGDDRGTLYLAMEYVFGVALNRVLVLRGRPLPPLIAAQIMADACRGLHAAHELTDLTGRPLGVVHRDITHGNLMLTFDGHVKIVDFGIALMHERESPKTQLGELKGKPSYMSPEQIRGEEVDRRSDVYSASVVLYELITGQKLFARPSVVATVMAVERGEVVPPSDIVGPLPQGLDAILQKGLSRNPDDRFETALALAAALDGVLQREGGERLEAFAMRELAEERERVQEWLRGALLALEDKTFRDDVPSRPIEAAFARFWPQLDAPPSAQKELPRRPRSTKLGGGVILLAFASTVVAALVSAGPAVDPTSVEDVPSAKDLPSSREARPLSDVGFSDGAPTHASNPFPRTPRTVVTATAGDLSLAALGDAREPLGPGSGRSRSKKSSASPLVAGHGFLTIGATPYALVRIDGQDAGSTPIMRMRLPVGRHTIQLVHPDTGAIRFAREITVEKDEHRRLKIPETSATVEARVPSPIRRGPSRAGPS